MGGRGGKSFVFITPIFIYPVVMILVFLLTASFTSWAFNSENSALGGSSTFSTLAGGSLRIGSYLLGSAI